MTRKQGLKLFAIFVGIAVAIYAALLGAPIIKYSEGSLRGVPLAFQDAFHNDDLLVCRLLLLLGSDIDAVTPGIDFTLLGQYAYSGDTEKVSTILDLGADPNAARGEWTRPLFLAIEEGHDDTAELLMDRGAELHFVDAVFMGDEGKARKMYEADPTVMNMTTYSELPILNSVFATDNYEAARILLELGADPREQGPYGVGSALDHARWMEDEEFIKLFESYLDADKSAEIDK